MKKFYLFILTIIPILLFSCSQENGPDEASHSDSSSIYHININLNASCIETTRVLNDENFIEGTETESEISLIRYFFFDEKGNALWVLPAQATNPDFTPYYDYTPNSADFSGVNSNSNVEKIYL